MVRSTEENPMSEMPKVRAAEFSRRSLLQSAASVAGAAAVLCVTANHAAAAKVSQKAVAYQDAPKGSQQCDNCGLFQPPNACKTVDGTISPKGWCRIYQKKS
jgi:hypothetical protein